VLTHWKEREPAYRSRHARILREVGHVPAYATTAAGALEDVEPTAKRRRTRRGSLIAPEEPGQQISRDEFQELVADLDVDERPGGAAREAEAPARGGAKRARAGLAERTPVAPEGDGDEQGDEQGAPARDPAADLAPEDLVLKDAPRPRPKRRSGASKRRKHGRSR